MLDQGESCRDIAFDSGDSFFKGVVGQVIGSIECTLLDLVIFDSLNGGKDSFMFG